MKNLLVAVLASIAVVAVPVTTSVAAEQSANVALTSNYVFRGITQTDDGVALQGSYDIKQSKDDMGWYAGVFGSNVDNGNNADGLEIDVYGGWKGSFGKQSALGYEVGGIVYNYTDSNFSKDIKEIFAGINYETAYFKLFIGDDGNQANGDYTYFDFGASFVIMKDIDLDLHAGHTSRDFAKDYYDASAALSMEVKSYDLSLSLTFEDLTDEVEFFVTVGKEFEL